MKVVMAFIGLCVVAAMAAPAPAESMEEYQPMVMGQENTLMSVDVEPKGDSAIQSEQGRAKRFAFVPPYHHFHHHHPYPYFHHPYPYLW